MIKRSEVIQALDDINSRHMGLQKQTALVAEYIDELLALNAQLKEDVKRKDGLLVKYRLGKLC